MIIDLFGGPNDRQCPSIPTEHMAAYQVLRWAEFVDSLPKSGSGKVMWRLLQEREQARAS